MSAQSSFVLSHDRKHVAHEICDRLASRSFRIGNPLGDIRLGLSCPACGHEWTARLDPLTQLRDALRGQAEQLLHEVDALARAYGWSEPEILALSRWRRRRYLDLAGA